MFQELSFEQFSELMDKFSDILSGRFVDDGKLNFVGVLAVLSYICDIEICKPLLFLLCSDKIAQCAELILPLMK